MKKANTPTRESDIKKANTNDKKSGRINQRKSILNILSKLELTYNEIRELVNSFKISEAHIKLKSAEHLYKDLESYKLLNAEYKDSNLESYKQVNGEYIVLLWHFKWIHDGIEEIIKLRLSHQSKPLKESICIVKAATESYNRMLIIGQNTIEMADGPIVNVDINEKDINEINKIKNHIIKLLDLLQHINQETLLHYDCIKKSPNNQELYLSYVSNDPILNETYQIYVSIAEVLYMVCENVLSTENHITDKTGKPEVEYVRYEDEAILFSLFLELLLFGKTNVAFEDIFERKSVFEIDDNEISFESIDFKHYLELYDNKLPDDDIERWSIIDYSHFEKLISSIISNDTCTLEIVDQLKATINHIQVFTQFIITNRKEKEDYAIREAERNRIMSNLSHSIKNMLRSVIDPLLLIKKEIPEKAKVIDEALKGANLIREIVNAINLSYKTTLEDLSFDINHHGKDDVSLQEMIVNSLKYSISNMFDDKYFPQFMQNYYPKREAYQKANAAWSMISSTNSVQEIVGFVSEYMFKLKFDGTDVAKYMVGNEKSSAIKLLIMFQEIIFNAVKYSSYVAKSNRYIEISLTEHNNNLCFKVTNSYNSKVQPKSTGVGKLIIENFAKVLGCEPVITMDKDVYSITMEFKDYWRET